MRARILGAMALVLMTRIALEVGNTSKATEYSNEIERLTKETPIPLHLFPCYSITAQVAEDRGELESEYC